MRAGRNIATVFASRVPEKNYRCLSELRFVSHAGGRIDRQY